MKHLSLIILLLFLFSCQDKKKEEIKHLISKWQGKEIQFPTGYGFHAIQFRYSILTLSQIHPIKF